MPSQIASEGDSFKVFVRVRPVDSYDHNDTSMGESACITVHPPTITLNSKNDAKNFTFDHVVDGHATQEAVFSCVGKPLIENCMSGYNATIFAYGQTGAGKTFTMLGPPEERESYKQEIRGVIPRSLEFLFGLIRRDLDMHGEHKHYLCKCSFLEIYNERVFDLLDPVSSGLTVRENMRHGVFVDGVIEQTVDNAAEAYQVLSAGWINRKVAATSMNRESSRSHAVFTVVVESKEAEAGIQRVRSSRLNLVDLAGSERQKDTKTSGLRLKEGSVINQSLSTLGNVIMALGQVGQGRSRYVPYRDSRLTFLLKDSLGGNAMTQLIACVHPHYKCFGETLSTLQFAKRAKLIKNKAVININSQGNVAELEAEICQLRSELARLGPEDILDGAGRGAVGEGGGWQEAFVGAMYLWDRGEKDKQRREAGVRNLKEVIRAKDKALMSCNMVIRFHVQNVETLKKATKVALTSDDINRTIVNLESEVKLWKDRSVEHKDCDALAGVVKALRVELAVLRDSEVVSEGVRHDEELVARLEAKYHELKEQGEIFDQPASCSACRKHTDDIKNLTQEVSQLNDKIKAAETKRTETESELEGERRLVAEYERMLSSRQRKNEIERQTMNNLHLQTIKNITTPTQQRYSLRSHAHPAHTSPMFGFITPDPFADSPCANIFDELPPKEITDALNEEIRALQESNRKLRSDVEDHENKSVSLNQTVVSLTSLSEKLEQTLRAEREDWRSKEADLNSQIGRLTQVLNGEIEDLRCILTATENRLTEKDVNVEATKTKRLKLDIKLSEMEKDNDTLTEQRDKLQETLENILATLTFTEERVQSLEGKVREEMARGEHLGKELQTMTAKYTQEVEENERVQASHGQQQVEQIACSRAELESLKAMNEFQSQQMVLFNTELNMANSTVNTQQQLLAENKEVVTSLTAKLQQIRDELTTMTDLNAALKVDNLDEASKGRSHEETCKHQMTHISALEESVGELNAQIERERSSHNVEANIQQDELDYMIDCRDNLTADVANLTTQVARYKTDLSACHTETDRLKSELEHRSAQLEQLTEQETNTPSTPVRNRVSELYEWIQSRDDQILAHESSLTELQRMLEDAVDTWTSKNSELQAAKESLKEELTQKGDLESSVTKLQVYAVNIENKNKSLTNKLNKATTDLALLRSCCQEFKDRCTRLELQQAVERVREETVKSLQEEVERFHRLAEKDLQEKNELRSELERLAESHKKLDDTCRSLHDERDRAIGQMNHKQKIHYHMALKSELNEYKQKLEQTQQELIKCKGHKSLREPLTENIDPNI